MKWALLLLLSLNSFAQESEGKSDSQENSENIEPVILMAPPVNPEKQYRVLEFRTSRSIELDEVIIQVDERKLEINAEKLEQQILEGRGDDVGNGGDHITEHFLSLTAQIKEDIIGLYGNQYIFQNGDILNLSQINPDVDDIIVVENIKSHEIEFNYIVAESKIFLKREFFNQAILEGNDLRQKVLHMLIVASGLSDEYEYQSIELYSQLSVGSGLPLCEGMTSKGFRINSQEIEMSSQSNPQELQSRAFSNCESRGLFNCREISSTFGGFASWAKYRIVIQGFSLSLSEQENSCEKAQRCHDLAQLAPIGQIGSQAFAEISREVLRACQ